MENNTEALFIAERLFTSIEEGDIETVRQLYADNAVVWHNTDGKLQPVDDNMRVLQWLAENTSNLRYEEVRRWATLDGFVQQHVLRGTNAKGNPFELAACVIVTVSDGAITRLDEYLDSAQAAGLSA